MWPFKYFPFQVLSRGAIYCAVNGILKIDCSNENSTSVFVTLLVFPFLKKNNLPWSNQVFHEIFQLTVWVPLQWLEEDSKERRHEDQPLKEKQRLSSKASDFDKVRREIVRRGNVLLISYRSKSLYLRLYICATQIEGTSCVAHKFNMFNFILQKNVYFSDYAKISPSCWLNPSLVQLCIQLARMELFFSFPQTQWYDTVSVFKKLSYNDSLLTSNGLKCLSWKLNIFSHCTWWKI